MSDPFGARLQHILTHVDRTRKSVQVQILNQTSLHNLIAAWVSKAIMKSLHVQLTNLICELFLKRNLRTETTGLHWQLLWIVPQSSCLGTTYVVNLCTTTVVYLSPTLCFKKLLLVFLIAGARPGVGRPQRIFNTLFFCLSQISQISNLKSHNVPPRPRSLTAVLP